MMNINLLQYLVINYRESSYRLASVLIILQLGHSGKSGKAYQNDDLESCQLLVSRHRVIIFYTHLSARESDGW